MFCPMFCLGSRLAPRRRIPGCHPARRWVTAPFQQAATPCGQPAFQSGHNISHLTGITNNATFTDMIAANFKLRLDQRQARRWVPPVPAGRTLVREMKDASQTISWGGRAKSSAVRSRAFTLRESTRASAARRGSSGHARHRQPQHGRHRDDFQWAPVLASISTQFRPCGLIWKGLSPPTV